MSSYSYIDSDANRRTELPSAECHVYWAPLSVLRPHHLAVLNAAERQRWLRYHHAEDRDRFGLATVLLRIVTGERLGMAPACVTIERTCSRCLAPHGPPRLPGTNLHVSVSHSGNIVAVALTTAGPVGVDIERISALDPGPLVDTVCATPERRHVRCSQDFFTYWTRKESILKATSHGLAMPLSSVLVSPPAMPPALHSYDGEIGPTRMIDLSLRSGYAGAATVLTRSSVEFDVAIAQIPTI